MPGEHPETDPILQDHMQLTIDFYCNFEKIISQYLIETIGSKSEWTPSDTQKTLEIFKNLYIQDADNPLSESNINNVRNIIEFIDNMDSSLWMRKRIETFCVPFIAYENQLKSYIKSHIDTGKKSLAIQEIMHSRLTAHTQPLAGYLRISSSKASRYLHTLIRLQSAEASPPPILLSALSTVSTGMGMEPGMQAPLGVEPPKSKPRGP